MISLIPLSPVEFSFPVPLLMSNFLRSNVKESHQSLGPAKAWGTSKQGTFLAQVLEKGSCWYTGKPNGGKELGQTFLKEAKPNHLKYLAGSYEASETLMGIN